MTSNNHQMTLSREEQVALRAMIHATRREGCFASAQICAAVAEGTALGPNVHLTQGDLALLAEMKRGEERRHYARHLYETVRNAEVRE